MGPRGAQKIWDGGVRSLAQLKNNPGILNKNQQLGLKYYEDLLKPIQRDQIDMVYLLLTSIISKKWGGTKYKLTLAGSYRRGKSQSGDIDCLISSPNFDLREVINLLQKYRLIRGVLALRKEKFMGIIRCPQDPQAQAMRLDIEFVPSQSWGSALLYFTGSREFNIELRRLAKSRGWKLNQLGLWDSRGTLLASRTEKTNIQKIGVAVGWTP